MQVIHELENIPFSINAFFSIGKFDGIHKGHLEVIKNLKRIAKKHQGKTIIIIFVNNPFLEKKHCHLFDLEKRKKIFEKLGLDYLVIISLKKVWKLSYATFLQKILDSFNCLGIVASDKLRVGFEKKGTKEKIRKFFEANNKKAYFIPSLKKSKQNISSSSIRKLIKSGKMEQANELLYSPFSIKNQVVSGEQLGRKINFPTVNLDYPDEMVRLKLGSYITLSVYKKRIFSSMSFVGKAFPLKNSAIPNIETHIFGFNDIIYAEDIEIFFIKFLAAPVKLKSPSELQELLAGYKTKVEGFLKLEKKQVASIKRKLNQFI